MFDFSWLWNPWGLNPPLPSLPQRKVPTNRVKAVTGFVKLLFENIEKSNKSQVSMIIWPWSHQQVKKTLVFERCSVPESLEKA